MTADNYALHALDDAPLVDGLDTLEDAKNAALDAEKDGGRRVVIVRRRDGQLLDPGRAGVPLTLGVFDVAELVDVHPETVRRWCREGTLPAAKVGREFRISSTELARYWAAQGGGELFPGLVDLPRPVDRRLDDLARKIRALPDDRRNALADALTER